MSPAEEPCEPCRAAHAHRHHVLLGRGPEGGERFDAAEAARIGLVTLAGDPDEVLTPVLDGLRRGSPQGLAESKRLVTAEVLHAFDRDTEDLAERSARLFASAEAHEGMAAFLERRDPAWVR